jgi:hypothetical protein
VSRQLESAPESVEAAILAELVPCGVPVSKSCDRILIAAFCERNATFRAMQGQVATPQRFTYFRFIL